VIRRIHSIQASCCAALLLAFAFPARATLDYSVSLANPEQHTFNVSLRIPNVHDQVRVEMPAWNATYQIRDFAYHVMQVAAADASGNRLPIVKLDKQTWQISGSGTVTVSYPSYWDEPGPFAAQLNPDHAFVNFAMILMYVPDRRSEDTRVSFTSVPAKWKIALELPKTSDNSAGEFGPFAAANYDALADAPAELGTFDEFAFDAGGRRIRVVVHGAEGDRARMTDTLKRIATYEQALMDGPPSPEYIFIFHIGPGMGGGGMEHANCTAIATGSPANIAGVSAHEFFHQWNVKRIRPQSLEPVDYAREMWTPSLWFAEGVTSTYGSYTLLRSGLWTPEQFYDDLAAQITTLESRPAHLWQSAEESSIDAWLEKYDFYRQPESSVSYYNKGQLLGVALDITIRDATDNRASLDDMIRALNQEFALRGLFYRDSEDLRSVAEQVVLRANPAANAGLREFFARYVSGTDEIPFAGLLARAGLVVKSAGRKNASFGFTLLGGRGAPQTIRTVDLLSSAGKVGLQPGDVLVSLNGAPVPGFAQAWLRDHSPGETLNLEIRRGEQEMQFSFLLGERVDQVYQIEEAANPTDKQRRIREGILHGATDPRK